MHISKSTPRLRVKVAVTPALAITSTETARARPFFSHRKRDGRLITGELEVTAHPGTTKSARLMS